MRVLVWVLLVVLAPSVLFVGVLVLMGLHRRFQIARTRRELERVGFVVSLPYGPESRPIWPRVATGVTGLIALIVTTSVLTAAAPSARTQAASAGSSIQGAPSQTSVVTPSPNSGPGHPASQHPTSSQDAPSPQGSTASSTSPPADGKGEAGAPSAVTALPTSATAIQLEWEAVSGAASYDIERSIDTVTWSAVASTDTGEQTQYTDVGLSSGTTYYYRVVAFVVGQDISTSDVVSATTTVDTSIAPEFTSATGSATSIELAWSDVDGELGYRIERSPDGTSGWTEIGTTGMGVTSYTDSGLVPATTYYYRVVALTSGGESPPSTAAYATTDPYGLATSVPTADSAGTSDGS